MKQTKIQKNIELVLTRLIKLSNEDNNFAKEFAQDLEFMINDIHGNNDGFGTEGQYDPRGDFRDGQ
jgi:hypothetical protein